MLFIKSYNINISFRSLYKTEEENMKLKQLISTAIAFLLLLMSPIGALGSSYSGNIHVHGYYCDHYYHDHYNCNHLHNGSISFMDESIHSWAYDGYEVEIVWQEDNTREVYIISPSGLRTNINNVNLSEDLLSFVNLVLEYDRMPDFITPRMIPCCGSSIRITRSHGVRENAGSHLIAGPLVCNITRTVAIYNQSAPCGRVTATWRGGSFYSHSQPTCPWR